MTIKHAILATTQVDKRLSEIPSYRGSNAVPPLCPVGVRQQLPENPLPQLLSQGQQGTDVANSRVSNYFSSNSCKATTGGPTSIATAAPNGQSGSLDRSTTNQLEHRCSDHSSDTDFDRGRVDAESCAIVPAKIKANRALWMQLMAWKEEPIPQACKHIYRRVRDMGAVYW